MVLPALAFFLSPPSNIVLPPRLGTFADLCDRLSDQGVSVRCAEGISNRMAAVSLRPRPWAPISAILARALDVEFIPLRDGTLEMRAHPNVRAAEQLEFARYTHHAEGNLRAALPEALSLAKVYADDDEGRTRLVAIARRGNESDSQNAHSTAAMLVLGNRNRESDLDLLPAYVLATAGLASLVQADALAYGVGVTNTAGGSLPDPVKWKPNIPSSRPRGLLVQRAHFAPWDGTIQSTRTGNLLMVVDPFLTRMGIKVGVYEPTFTPSSLADWLADRAPAFRSASLTSSLEAPYIDLLKPIRMGAGLRSMSAMLLRWSAATRQDLAMEVSPVRDEILIPPSANQTATVASFLWPEPWWLERAEGAWSDSLPLEDRYLFPAADRLRRIRAWGKVRPWRPEVVEGVLVVRNDLAFLDRRYTAPFSKLFPAGSTASLPDRPPFCPSLKAFVAIAGALKKGEEAALARLDLPWASKGLVGFLPFARPLANLDKPTREALFRDLRTKGVIQVPLTGAARTVFADSFTIHALARDDFSRERLDVAALALNPSFRTNLIGSVLRIRRIDRNEDQSDYLAEILIPEKPEGDLKPALRAVLEEVPLADNSLAASP